MNKKVLIGLGLLIGFFAFAGKKTVDLLNGISVGKPSIKAFSIISDQQVFFINNFSDFKDTIRDIKNSISLNDVITLNFPSINFKFDLLLPVTNNNNVAIPNNSWSGTMSVGGARVSDVSYPPTELPANSTTNLQTNVTTAISQIPNLVKVLLQNPSALLNGADFSGTFRSGSLSAPYSFNAKFF